MPGTTLPRGNILANKMFAVSITPTEVAASTTDAQSFTIQGLAEGDFVICSSNAAQTAGIQSGNCRVTATNTLEIQFVNASTGALTPVAGVYNFIFWRSEDNTLPDDAN